MVEGLLDTAGRVTDAVRDESISLVVGSLLAVVAGYLRWLVLRRLPARRMWRFTGRARIVVVVATSALVDTGKYQRPTTGLGQVRANALLMPLLNRTFRAADHEGVSFSSTVPGSYLESDLLLVGGARSNEITRRAIESMPGLPLTAPGNTINWEGTLYEGRRAEGTVVRDYGYVVRGPNPFAPDRRIVIVAGSHTFGTVAAARWLAECGGARDLPEDVAVLVTADVYHEDHVGVPTVVATRPLS